MNTSTIPADLKALPQWVAWRYEERDGDPTKVPINPKTGQRADATDPATWGTLDEAVSRAAKGGLPGIGFVFSAEDPYAGVDLDKCRDPQTGRLDEDAAAIVAGLDSYTEASPSGTGVHVIVRGRVPGSRKRSGGVEIYDHDRFFTITGERLPDAPQTVNDRQLALTGLYFSVFGGDAEPDRPADLPPPTGLDKNQVIVKLLTDGNKQQNARLWSGDTGDFGGDDSAADWNLIRRIAFYVGGDPDLIEAVARESGLVRDKWDERRGRVSYLQLTIRNALAAQKDFYKPTRKECLEEVHPIEKTRELLLLPSNQFLEEVQQGGSIGELLLTRV